MCAKLYNFEDVLYKERRLMKVELTHREIELILTLINDATSGDFNLGDTSIYTNEEAEVVKKLEEAIKKAEGSNSPEDPFPGHSSEIKH